MLRQIFRIVKLTHLTHPTITNKSHNSVTRANGLCHWPSDGSYTSHGQWTSKQKPAILQKKPDQNFKKHSIKTHKVFVFQHRKMGKRMDFFFFLMFHYLTNINGGPKRENIQSTVESTKQQTGRIGTIFFPLVSFLNL